MRLGASLRDCKGFWGFDMADIEPRIAKGA